MSETQTAPVVPKHTQRKEQQYKKISWVPKKKQQRWTYPIGKRKYNQITFQNWTLQNYDMNTSPSEDGFRSSLDRKKNGMAKHFPSQPLVFAYHLACLPRVLISIPYWMQLNCKPSIVIYSIYTDFNFQKPFNIFTQRFMPPMTQKYWQWEPI